MADDLARCFELNASRIQSVFDEICRKYDRAFPDDDIVELRQNRFVRDRGVLKSMRSKQVGNVTFGKHWQLKADSHSPESDLGHISTSPEPLEKSFQSEKSFISVNCSRWVNDIEEESEPSDAETLTSDSEDDDSTSWEDETEESVPQSGSESTDAADEEEDYCVPEHRAEEEGRWLTIREPQHWQRHSKRSPNKKTKHKHSHTSHHSIVYKNSKQKGRFVGTHNSEFTGHKQRTAFHNMSASRREREHHSQETPESVTVAEQNIDRVGPPRRVRPIQLFSQIEGSGEISGVFSTQRKSFRNSDTDSEEESPTKKVFSNVDNDGDSLEDKSAKSESTTELQPSRQRFLSSGCDDVDFYLPGGSVAEIVHIGLSPENSLGGNDTDFDGHGKYHAEAPATHSSPFSRYMSPNTFTVSKCNPPNIVVAKHSRDQIHNGTNIGTFGHADDKLKSVHLKEMREGGDIDREQEGAEAGCAVDKTQAVTQTSINSCSSQMLQMKHNLAHSCELSKVTSCAVPKTAVDVPHTLHDIPQNLTPLQSSAAQGMKTFQDIDLKPRGKSLAEIKKKLDRLFIMFNGTNNSTPERPLAPGKPKQLNENEGSDPEVGLMAAAQPEEMETSPAGQLREKHSDVSASPFPKVTIANTDMFPTSEQHSPCERGGESVSPTHNPANRTFIVSDKTDCEDTQSEEISPCDCEPTAGWTCDLAACQVPSRCTEQEGKTKRKFRPVFKPFSTEEIQEVLEMENSDSFISFLNERYIKDEPESEKEDDESQVKLFPSSQDESGKHASQANPLRAAELYSAQQASYRPEMNRSVECCQVPKENINMQKTDKNNAANLPVKCSLDKMPSTEQRKWKNTCSCLDAKIFSRSPKAVESKLRVDCSGKAQGLSHEPLTNQSTVFQATPGQIFRQTITSLHIPLRITGTDLSVAEHESKKISVVQHGVKDRKSQDGLVEHRERFKMEPSPRVDFSSVSRDQTEKSVSFFTELGSDSVFPAAFSPSLGAAERKAQVSGSAIHSLFLQMKQSADSKTPPKPQLKFSSSLEEKRVCCDKPGLACVQLCQSSQNPHKHKHEADLWGKTDLAVVADRCYQGKHHFVKASSDNPLSLLDKLEGRNSVPSEPAWKKMTSETRQKPQKESGWSKTVTAADAYHSGDAQCKGKLSGSKSTVQHKEKESEDLRCGKACLGTGSPSLRCKTNCSASGHQTVNRQHDGVMFSRPHGTECTVARKPDHTDLYRTQKGGDDSNGSMNSVSCDSLSVTPQNQTADASQSTTPSKLLNRLSLSDPRSPLNLTKNCDKLSRLMLDSPGEKKREYSNQAQSRSDRHLEQEGLDSQQQTGSLVVTPVTKPQCDNHSWKIFKSKNSRSAKQLSSERSASPCSGHRVSSPQQDTRHLAGSPKPNGSFERKMIHISSLQARKIASPFSFSSDSPVQIGSCKRSLESDMDEESNVRSKGISHTSSPLKRRRLDSILGTSTPSKSDNGASRFNMDESLSTIAGDSVDLNGTLNSSDICPLDDPDCCSDEEDEITLIPE
ncbi:uncharacterized protein LOC143299113 [Babylonia areolata]|uniref:uncharacterized protein LOC143299113 n=1 Tax=Babylonia areolata TaxID=304850 RepID=UPI003FD31F22